MMVRKYGGVAMWLTSDRGISTERQITCPL